MTKKLFHFTNEQLDELKRDYHNHTCKELAERFGCSKNTVYNKANQLKLKKNIEFIKETARKNFTENHPAKKYWIKKGSTSPNKGKKMEQFVSPEGILKIKETQFKKGYLPHNTLHDGVITKRGVKSGRTYLYVRISVNKWIPYHRYIWEQAHGAIPKGLNVQFKDKNTLNCTLDNLYLIERAKQLKEENSFYANYPEEVHKLIQLKGALKRQINKIEKNGNY